MNWYNGHPGFEGLEPPLGEGDGAFSSRLLPDDLQRLGNSQEKQDGYSTLWKLIPGIDNCSYIFGVKIFKFIWIFLIRKKERTWDLPEDREIFVDCSW